MRAGVVFCLGVGVGVVVALCIMRRSQSKVKLVEDKNQAEVGPTASGKIANDSDGVKFGVAMLCSPSYLLCVDHVACLYDVNCYR